MRISTTTLESFRLFMQQDWMTEAELVSTIKGEFVSTPAVRLGKAFGYIIETPHKYAVQGGYRCDGYTFDDATLAPAFALIDRRGVFEAKSHKAYGQVDVVAMADHLLGAHLSEFKTTGSQFNFDKYADSCQWRFMTDIFEPALITYHVFPLNDHGNGVVEVRMPESFTLYPYPRLHQDCCALLSAFVEYVTRKGLAPLLQQRQREAVAYA